jgi:transposase
MFHKDTRRERDQIMTSCTLDSLVPQDHLVRKIEAALDFSFIYDLTRDLYSSTTGRPSLDPVLLFKLVFLQYLFGIRSMRQTVREVEVNVAYRWFLGLGLTDPVPNYSTFSQNYIRRYKDSSVFEKIFEHILEQARALGYVNPQVLFVDSTHVKANANRNKKRRIEVEERVSRMKDLLDDEVVADREREGKRALKGLVPGEGDGSGESKEREGRSVRGETSGENRGSDEGEERSGKRGGGTPARRPDTGDVPVRVVVRERTVSTTDPESGLFCKGEHERQFAYSAHTVCESNAFILGYTVTGANVHDSVAFPDLYDSVRGRYPQITYVVADAGYKTPGVCKQIMDDGRIPILPYTRPTGSTSGTIHPLKSFRYDKEKDRYLCPAGQVLTYRTTTREGRREYKADRTTCRSCGERERCTTSRTGERVVTRHLWSDYLDHAESLRLLPGIRELYRRRSQTIERIFADGKERHCLRYTLYRGRARVTMQIGLIYACMNLKKLAKKMAKDPRFGPLSSLRSFLRRLLLEISPFTLWITPYTASICE